MDLSKRALWVSIILHAFILLALVWAVQSYSVKGTSQSIMNAYFVQNKIASQSSMNQSIKATTMPSHVIPMQMGIQNTHNDQLDSRLRGNDSVTVSGTTPSDNSIAKTAVNNVLAAAQIQQLLQIIASDIQQNLHYPHLAQTHILQGQSVLQFDVDPEGDVQNIQLIQSSGVAVLDEAAKQAIEASSPINIPSGIQLPEAITLRLPVTFKIQD